MSLAIYRWEKEQFHWHWRVEIRPEYRVRLTQILGRRWGLGHVSVVLRTRGGGSAHSAKTWSQIALPAPRHPCSLGLILHELAHVHDFKNFGGNGHRATFKKSLIKLFVEVRSFRVMPVAFWQIRLERHRALVEASKASRAAQAASRRLQRVGEAREAANSPAGRLKRVQARAKRLRTRIKRLQTALAKAERQARRLERRLDPAVRSAAGQDAVLKPAVPLGGGDRGGYRDPGHGAGPLPAPVSRVL